MGRFVPEKTVCCPIRRFNQFKEWVEEKGGEGVHREQKSTRVLHGRRAMRESDGIFVEFERDERSFRIRRRDRSVRERHRRRWVCRKELRV